MEVSSIAIPPEDPACPPALAALSPPPTLYVWGGLPAAPGVAIVGTREASPAARAFTRSLPASRVAEGIPICSGGAVGIDAAAREAVLDVAGITVLVAGGGVDRPYPAQHRGLFERVVSRGGALVVRVPDGTPPMPP